MERYDRIARFYDVFEGPMELMNFRKWRREFFGLFKSKDALLLEVGVGTGKNIQYYPESRVVAIDISMRMIEKAKKRAEKLGKNVEFVIADVEYLPFRDDVFDLVFATFVFCSVENPVRGMKEVRRVTKGRVYFMEHMLPESEFLRPFFNAFNPIARLFGPEINRKTDKNIEKAGFMIVSQKFLLRSVFRIIIAEKGENRYESIPTSEIS